MRIGIDARLYGPEHTGLGRYITNLVNHLLLSDKKNEYVLFVNTKHQNDFPKQDNLKIVCTNIPIYSFSEQLILPIIFMSQKLDLLHSPHFNTPLFYPGKLVITIHDLIKHKSKGSETTTRNPLIYQIIRLGYHFLSYLVVKKAAKIIVPTEYVKKELQQVLKVSPDKIKVTYESAESGIKKVSLDKQSAKSILDKYDLVQPFLIYTGNVYPHKNLDILIEAVVEHNKNREVDLVLAIVCARSVFQERLKKKVDQLHAGDQVKMLGFVDDADLSKLYSLALSLVHPSKMEGFGLTGLEAMSVGLPVISSNASCLPEVYGDACLYFDPNSKEDLIAKIEQLIQDIALRHKLSAAGPIQAKKYSWKKMTKETLNIYHEFSKQ